MKFSPPVRMKSSPMSLIEEVGVPRWKGAIRGWFVASLPSLDQRLLHSEDGIERAQLGIVARTHM